MLRSRNILFVLTFNIIALISTFSAMGQKFEGSSPPGQQAQPTDFDSTPWSRIASLDPCIPTPTRTAQGPIPNNLAPAMKFANTCDLIQPYYGQMQSPLDCNVLQHPNLSYQRLNNPWHFSAAGLSMGRSKPRRVWTTYENNNNPNQLMATDDAGTDFVGGVELHLGRKIACGAYTIDLGYWTLDDFEGMASQTHVNMVSTPLLFNDLEFSVGDPVQEYFDSADEHRLLRRNTMQNLELNLIEAGGACGSCSLWRSRKSIGIRYFQFDEDLSLSTLDAGGTWGGNGGRDEVTMINSTENNLLGVQLGYQLDRQIGQKACFFIAPKFGIYNNRVENRFDLRRGDGIAAMPSAASNVSGGYPVESADNVVSFLSELNLGISWQPTCRWSFFGGYRVMAITGVALADSQIPQYIIDLPEIQDIDTQDSLILHGAFFGVAYSH